MVAEVIGCAIDEKRGSPGSKYKGAASLKECRPLSALITSSVTEIILRSPRNQPAEDLPTRKHYIVLHADVAPIRCNRRRVEPGLSFVAGCLEFVFPCAFLESKCGHAYGLAHCT